MFSSERQKIAAHINQTRSSPLLSSPLFSSPLWLRLELTRTLHFCHTKSRAKLTHSEFLVFRRYPHVYAFSPIERPHEENRTALNIGAKSHAHILRAPRAPPTLIVQSARATKYTGARERKRSYQRSGYAALHSGSCSAMTSSQSVR